MNKEKIQFFILATLKSLSLLLIGVYRTLGTQFFGGNCRFSPSCSDYAAQCFNDHAPHHAFKLTFLRLCKCRPGGPFGYDPVPPKDTIYERSKTSAL